VVPSARTATALPENPVAGGGGGRGNLKHVYRTKRGQSMNIYRTNSERALFNIMNLINPLQLLLNKCNDNNELQYKGCLPLKL
jgi:hypothetical protein